MSTVVEVADANGRLRTRLDGLVVVPRLIRRGRRSARIALVAGGALLLGGDEVRIEVRVGRGCLLELEDIGGTVAYSADGERSSWEVDVVLEERAALSWHGLPLVVAHGADVHRALRLRLGRGVTALLRETTVLGRHGEPPGRLHARTSIADPDGSILEESLEADTLALPGVLGGRRVLDTVLAAGFRPDPEPGMLRWEQPGALLRHLGADAHDSPLPATWRRWRAELDLARGREPDPADRTTADPGPLPARRAAHRAPVGAA